MTAPPEFSPAQRPPFSGFHSCFLEQCFSGWDVCSHLALETSSVLCLLGALNAPHASTLTIPAVNPTPSVLPLASSLAPPATARPLCLPHLLCSDSGPSSLTKVVSLLSSEPQMDSGSPTDRCLTLSSQYFLFP